MHSMNRIKRLLGAGLGAAAVGGFNDDSLAADLGLDGVTEAVIHTVALGRPHE
jgi:nitroreductase